MAKKAKNEIENLDFERIKNELIAENGEDEEILEDITEWSKKTNEHIQGIFDSMDKYLLELVYDEVSNTSDGERYISAREHEIVMEKYLEKNPNEKKNDYNSDAYDEFFNNFLEDWMNNREEDFEKVHDGFKHDAVWVEDLLDDNVLEELRYRVMRDHGHPVVIQKIQEIYGLGSYIW